MFTNKSHTCLKFQLPCEYPKPCCALIFFIKTLSWVNLYLNQTSSMEIKLSFCKINKVEKFSFFILRREISPINIFVDDNIYVIFSKAKKTQIARKILNLFTNKSYICLKFQLPCEFPKPCCTLIFFIKTWYWVNFCLN